MEQLRKITNSDLSGKLHVGQEDSPELGTQGMQELFDAHPNLNTEVINQNADRQNANNTETAAHLANRQNPHGVTKAQIGLGNVDNTRDAAKPISAAQQAALDKKVDKIAGMGLSHNDYTDAEKAEVAKVRDKADKTETARIQSEVDRKAERGEVLTKTNTTPYTPAQEYHPATKEYVDRIVNESGNVTMEQVERWDSRTVILCDCTYDPREKTFHLTRKDTGQTITDGAALQFIPPVDYTRWDKMTVDGEPVDLGYTQSRIELQDGAWLAGRQIQVYLSAGGGGY